MPPTKAEQEASIRAAQSIRLDSDRQQLALARIAGQREVAEYHERAARSARGTMLTLVRTWELCAAHPVNRRHAQFRCCGDPERCQWPDPSR
jgi:hypothetical protein